MPKFDHLSESVETVSPGLPLVYVGLDNVKGM